MTLFDPYSDFLPEQNSSEDLEWFAEQDAQDAAYEMEFFGLELEDRREPR